MNKILHLLTGAVLTCCFMLGELPAAQAAESASPPPLPSKAAKVGMEGKSLMDSKATKARKAVRSAKSSQAAASSKNTRAVRVLKRSKLGKAKQTQFVSRRGGAIRYAVIPLKPSFGEVAGLHTAHDALALRSSVALVVDQDTHEVLLSKNDRAVLPIASITKLMTGVILSEANLPMDTLITISQDDVDGEKGSRSRLKVGTELSRGEFLHLALMSSENRAANALGRTFPGGMNRFVALMNARAAQLGMSETHYAEPTGLSSKNQSSAKDLVRLVNFASENTLLRELSTSPSYAVAVGNRTLQFNNTNRLVKNPAWEIGLQKTGYITEAGQCLVMQAKVAGRKLIMVFLDSAGRLSRIGDAERVRRWVESNPSLTGPVRPVA